MNTLTVGVLWGLTFVIIEAFQFVYFGNIFQNISPFLFGFLVFGIIMVVFVGGAVLKSPEQVKSAFKKPLTLFKLNLTATFAVACYLGAVELLEPAVVYTISAGIMPVTAYLAKRISHRARAPRITQIEKLGMTIVLGAVAYLALITIFGKSGFVQGDETSARFGVLLAIGDGVFFTWMLIYSKRMDLSGVGPSVVFGLRFMLYVVIAGGLTAVGYEAKPPLPMTEIIVIVFLGFLLTAPHLFALQIAVTKLSTFQLSALSTLGPFLIFLLQIFEGRVVYSSATLAGLLVYFLGSALSLSVLLKKSPRIKHV